jgi:N-acetylmuramate 1-kinase
MSVGSSSAAPAAASSNEAANADANAGTNVSGAVASAPARAASPGSAMPSPAPTPTPTPLPLDTAHLESLVQTVAGGRGRARWESMPGGASTRSFFRVRFDEPERTAVAFHVPDHAQSDEIDKTDGTRARMPFLEVRDLLDERGVRVPSLLADGTDRGWVVVEDLGDDTLAAFLQRAPHRKAEVYERAVRDLARAQRVLAELPAKCVITRRAFDEDLLAWEMHHFREWALEARGITLSEADRALFDGVVERLSRRIAAWPRGFVHRDYQSRNLMVLEGPHANTKGDAAGEGPLELVWIDFQDALLGPRIYDLVALLNDSYQTFDRAFVEARLGEFGQELELSPDQIQSLIEEFDVVTVQRKLKDAGRFFFIDRVKNNPSFLGFVEPTIQKARGSLQRLAPHDDDMRTLEGILDRVLGPFAPDAALSPAPATATS